MSYTYAGYVTACATLLVVDEANANFLSILPRAIEYAELRLYRELDFLATRVSPTVNLTANSRDFTGPSGMIVCEQVNAITPAATNPVSGTRWPLTRVTTAFLDFIWPIETGVGNIGVPQYYALLTDQTGRVAPTPDAAYKLEFVNTARPTTLSAANTTTWITTYMPDIFLAASMVFLSGYQQNFGKQSDDPQEAQSWESQYKLLMAGSQVEEARRKSEGAAWTGKMPTPIAVPPRQ